jgi:hypothetical protein
MEFSGIVIAAAGDDLEKFHFAGGLLFAFPAVEITAFKVSIGNCACG